MSAPAEEPTLFDSMVKPKLSPAYPDRAPWGTSVSLRAWQAEAMQKYFETNPRDFMAVATPGAGKTTFALTLAKELFNRGTVRQLIVVAPTDHLKKQWADAAAKVGIPIDPNFKNADVTISRHYKGVALTYAQVANKPQLHARNTEETKTLVIFDEIHHAGDSLSWGDGLREAFDDATRRVALTGTPFRSDTSPIPFVTYEVDNDGIRRSKADYSYGYGPALKDHVVRPVIFMAYSGQMRWRTSAGEEMAANLGEGFTKDITSQAWRTALDPNGEWIPTVLAAADKRLTEVRRTVPDAGALVIATDHADAKAYAEQIQKITGEYPAVILSDDREASAKIDEFREGMQRWMVAVRMVSEGVDVPRLAVGVYATSTSTPLFFAQAIGRFVRARKRGETASVFLPSVPQLMMLATTWKWNATTPSTAAHPRKSTPWLKAWTTTCSKKQTARSAPPSSWHAASLRRSAPRRPSTVCCSTAPSSPPATLPWVVRRSRTSWVFRVCWMPNRWVRCCERISVSMRRAARQLRRLRWWITAS